MKELTKEIFLKEIENHSVKIIKDEGIYRHLVCSNGSFNQHFEIVTWPGYLSYVGDMGSYTFSRIDDMFSFFRNTIGETNPQYWAEKVIAQSIFGGGIEKFSVEEFRDAVREATRSYLDKDEHCAIPDEILEDIEPLLSADDEYECVAAMRDFNSPKIDFADFWERSVKRYTWHYLWCCYAIVWAINKYDEATH